jgi:hypothetical protein
MGQATARRVAPALRCSARASPALRGGSFEKPDGLGEERPDLPNPLRLGVRLLASAPGGPALS